MKVRQASASWNGSLKDGAGEMKLESRAYEGSYSFESRFEEGTGTNPEELIAAAHAGCFTMALSHALSEAGYPPEKLQTTAKVYLEKSDNGFEIPKIEIETEGTVPDIEEQEFQEHAKKAKQECPVSKLVSGAEIALNATLRS